MTTELFMCDGLCCVPPSSPSRPAFCAIVTLHILDFNPASLPKVLALLVLVFTHSDELYCCTRKRIPENDHENGSAVGAAIVYCVQP